MSNIAFTQNYTDHSNNNGYQFEFHCDKCGNGYRSSYAANKLGMASSFLGAAADMFGGVLGQAANAGNQLKDALRGKAWDDAFANAVGEIKPKFHQCTRCGKWVCPEVCWNAKASLCKDCAPDLGEETAAAQADALRLQVQTQMQAKAQSVDLVGSIDIKQQGSGVCPSCRAPVTPGAKFCGGCGKPTAPQQGLCTKCGKPMPAASKFCPECGAQRG